MKLPGGKIIANKVVAIAGAGVVVAAGAAVGIVLSLNGKDAFRNISVLDAIGSVSVFRESVGDTLDAYSDMNLESGDDVKVGAASELDLRLDEDKYVYLNENTHIWLEADGDAQNSKTVIHMDEGTTLHKIDNKLGDNATYQVETPNATMAIRGTIMNVDVYADEEGIFRSNFSFPEGHGELQLKTETGELVGDPVEIPQGYAVDTRGNQDFSEIVLKEVNGEEQELHPIEYEAYGDWALNKLENINSTEERALFTAEKEWKKEETKEEPKTEEPKKEEPKKEAQKKEETEKKKTSTDPMDILYPLPASQAPATTPVEEPVPEPAAIYTVVFSFDSGTFGSQSVEAGATVQAPLLQPTAEAGSWTDENGNPFDFSTPINADVTLYWRN